MTIEVRARYTFLGSFAFDDIAHKAAGRTSDFGGSGFGERDLGWVVRSELEAWKMKKALDRVGLKVEIRGLAA